MAALKSRLQLGDCDSVVGFEEGAGLWLFPSQAQAPELAIEALIVNSGSGPRAGMVRVSAPVGQPELRVPKLRVIFLHVTWPLRSTSRAGCGLHGRIARLIGRPGGRGVLDCAKPKPTLPSNRSRRLPGLFYLATPKTIHTRTRSFLSPSSHIYPTPGIQTHHPPLGLQPDSSTDQFPAVSWRAARLPDASKSR